MNTEYVRARLGLEGAGLISARGGKWLFAQPESGRAVSAIRFASRRDLEAFAARREALRGDLDGCPGLNLPRPLEALEAGRDWLLAEALPLASDPPPPETGRLEALLEALKAMHGAGWTHMDVKPEHLLWVEGRWTLNDFDGAKRLGERYWRRDITPAYAPPEVWFHDVADGVDDLYAAALMLYQSLNGALLPYGRWGEGLSARIRRVARRLPPPAEATEEQRRFLERALCRDRAGRFQTIGEFIGAWRRVQHGESE